MNLLIIWNSFFALPKREPWKILCTFLLLGALSWGLAAPGLSMGAEVAESPPRLNPHDFSNRKYCTTCHGAPPALKFDSVTTCTRCHIGHMNNHPVVNHPIGKVPAIRVNRKMPLDRDRKMVCYTCHDQHGRRGHKYMLRVEFDRLCSACHRGY